MRTADAVIVGSRCAGSTLALALARRGWEVILVDRESLPSETVSTHLIFPNTLARFKALGVLDTLLASHELPMLKFRIVGFGHEIAGPFTPLSGFDRCAAPRRSALDKAILDTALAAGACGCFKERVVDLIGSGTAADPVTGVVLESGERIGAKWVFGADGRASTVAGRLGIAKTRVLQGDVGFLFAYWRGIPNDGYASSHIRTEEIVNRWACEDGVCLLIAWGDEQFTRGSKEERRRRYIERLHRFPELIAPGELADAEMIGEVVVAPPSLMRGYFRSPSGCGWALVGDASHFKHPGTAQGIADAVEQALYVAEAVCGPDAGLDGYERWRDERSSEHYSWSFTWGCFPPPESESLFRGWASDADAAQDLRDSFSRRLEPSAALSQERISRWLAS
ncbi:MAG TPA: NAD(P)/FAD-dependent oxidoreductase [Solirubrobacteraceae bacterium]|nr:NAD(P)/FAD-dependent oxidoreductase [Solirubrobacteraceae bacterium]